jgi:post-segregation antitoxin (ccd killing protein)
MNELQNSMAQFFLPWFDHDGEYQLSSMTIAGAGKVDKRKCWRQIRKWYKNSLGVTIDKDSLERLWVLRTEMKLITEQSISKELHQMARDSYEENKAITDTSSEEGPAQETGE